MSAPNDETGNAIAETENYIAWEVQDPDGETTYHLELGRCQLALLPRRMDRIPPTDQRRRQQQLMAQPQLARHFVEVMAKHLPPSASTMQLVDIGGHCGAVLAELRDDLEIQTAIPAALAQLPASSIDAVTAFDVYLSDNVLSSALEILRPGGRFIAALSSQSVDESWLRLLQSHGYTRILVEAAVDGVGVLIRGEKAHESADTLQRIRSVATADDDRLDLSSYRGRYLHLLIRQSPQQTRLAVAPGRDHPLARLGAET